MEVWCLILWVFCTLPCDWKAQAESPASPASPASPVVSRNLLEIQGGGIRRAWPLVQGETGEVELQKGLYLLQTKGVPDWCCGPILPYCEIVGHFSQLCCKAIDPLAFLPSAIFLVYVLCCFHRTGHVNWRRSELLSDPELSWFSVGSCWVLMLAGPGHAEIAPADWVNTWHGIPVVS